jgi:outer membrane protein assembly factor BamB
MLAQTGGALQLKNINDLTMGTKGQLYFTNWDGGQVFYRDPTTGTTSVALSGFVHANGIFLVEEDSMIYINEDSPGIIYKYKVGASGALTNRTEFARANVSDGLRVDIHGNVYCAANADKTVCVFNKAGALLGKIDLSAVTQYTTNCAFGGAGDKTLYITGSNAVYKVDLQIPGRRLSTMTGTLGGFAARPAAFGGYRFVREAQTVRILLPAGVTAGHYGVFDLGGRLVRVLVPFSAQSGDLECAWEQGSAQNSKTSCGWYVVRPLAGVAAPAALMPLFH